MTAFATVTFASALDVEFERRRSVNARYSLRAFAAALGINHSIASRCLRGDQRASDATILAVGRRLKWTDRRIEALIREERVHRLLDATSSARSVVDARSLAARANLSLDEVQLALHEAIRTGRLDMKSRECWQVTR